MKEIIFKGKPYIFTEDTLVSGAICTKEEYENGEIPYAHLSPDGNVRRFLKIIGHMDDIKFGDEIELNFKPRALINMVFGFLELLDKRMNK